ncbi:MAG: NAD(P)H-dependent oxidoreductase [Candidatus Sulfomarinibacteraceae bacterium]
MNKVLVLFAHPRPDRSEVNVALANAARAIEGVTVVDLYAEYPTFEIDVDREQRRLLEHDVIVFQHPVYWYSSPAVLKEWQDLVLEYGFAYGTEGTALEGKVLVNAVTAGAGRDVYSHHGGYSHELRDFFIPFEQTARLCRMRYLPPFALFGAGHAADDGRLEAHRRGYTALLEALVDGRLDLDRAEEQATLSDNLDSLISAPAGVR